EALAADVTDARVLVLELAELGCGDLAEPCSATGEVIADDDVELLQRHGRHHRVAGVGAGPRQACVAARALGDLLGGDRAADGEAGGEALAPGDDVGG